MNFESVRQNKPRRELPKAPDPSDFIGRASQSSEPKPTPASQEEKGGTRRLTVDVPLDVWEAVQQRRIKDHKKGQELLLQALHEFFMPKP